ncbi:MAG: NAD(P)-dependent oxidoreductase [Deltaproteobacteria bacterium]|nr:NAD(P)-dependent oxidoreductase [Deltaproteobacteria bacterium]
MRSLRGKTLFITGSSRGIGLAIGLRAARDGANVVITGKTVEPHSKLPGTIFTAAAEIEAAGGHALPLSLDVRSEEQVHEAVKATLARFGGLDVLVNNASAISLTDTSSTPMKRWDLMHQVNARATFLCTQACLLALRSAENPHVLVNAPPPTLDPKWFKGHVAYSIAKLGMSFCVLGMAEEFRELGIAVNALWPKTTIATSAIDMLGGDSMRKHSRKPDVMADAAHAIVTRPAKACTGNFFIDEVVLREEGVTDFTTYAVDPSVQPIPDFFLD